MGVAASSTYDSRDGSKFMTRSNVNTDGQARRLLHVDPQAPDLRPARQAPTGRAGPDNPAHQHSNVSGYSVSGNALTRVDHVVAGPERTFAVQGALNDPTHLRAHVPVLQAMQMSVEQSDAKLMAENQVISQELALTQRQEISRNQAQSIGLSLLCDEVLALLQKGPDGGCVERNGGTEWL
jgi:hypothetical protein